MRVKSLFVASTAALAGLAFVGAANAASFTVNGTDSLYNYGGTSVAGAGSTSPTEIALPGTPGESLTFSGVTGSVIMTPGGGPDFGPHGPDGSPPDFTMTITGTANLSGIVSSNVGYLAGVFLNGNEGSNPTPPTLDFSSGGLGESFTSLSPQIDQVFFIGDGLTGTGSGSVQTFFAPTGATTLVLGIVDGFNYSGAPGAYFDNGGLFSGAVNVSGAVPEPVTWVMMVVGLGLAGAGLRINRQNNLAPV